MNRRQFLQASGALIVSFRAFPQGPIQGTPALNQVDSWLAIAADGSITAFSGKEELGQGISTAQTQLVAEELSVPFNRINLIYCDTARTPDQAHTSGSQSHPANFNHSNLAQAAATARETLFRLASDRLGVPVGQLAASDGVISAKSDASKRITYGQLVGGKQFSLTVDPRAKRKPPNEWTVLGKPVPRPDLPALVSGEFEFVHNVRLPGMLHGRVVRPPAIGATVISVDEASVQGMPGVVKVVVKKNFVGVVAQKPWQALQAAGKLKVNWTPGTGLPSHADFYQDLRNQKQTRDTLMVDSKDVDQKLASAATATEGDVSSPVSDAWIDGQLLRGGRRSGREGDHLFAHAGGLVSAQHLRHDSRIEAGERPRDFPPGLRLLRLERRGHRDL